MLIGKHSDGDEVCVINGCIEGDEHCVAERPKADRTFRVDSGCQRAEVRGNSSSQTRRTGGIQEIHQPAGCGCLDGWR